MSKKAKEELVNAIGEGKYLKILSFEEDFEQRKKLMFYAARTSTVIAVFFCFVFIFLSYSTVLNWWNNDIGKTILALLGFLLFLLLLYFFIQSLNINLLIRLKKYIFIAIPIEFWIVFSLFWLIPYLKNEEWMYRNFALNLSVFILSTLFTIAQTYLILKYFPTYFDESLNTLIVTFLTIRSLLTLVWSPQIIEPKNIWELFISWGLILTTTTMILIQLFLFLDSKLFKSKHFKNEDRAQEIFQEQLLLKVPQYEKLKKCYSYGGEKYKEKLLSNEKFLKVIMASEIGSLNVMETYEDYKLYKEVKYKNYLESINCKI